MVPGRARRRARERGRDHGRDRMDVRRAAHQGRAGEGGDRRAVYGGPRGRGGARAGAHPAARGRGGVGVAGAPRASMKFVVLLWIFLKSTSTSFAGLASLPEIRHELV